MVFSTKPPKFNKKVRSSLNYTTWAITFFVRLFCLCYCSFDKSKLKNVKRKHCGLDIFFLRLNLASFCISRLTSSSEQRKHSASCVFSCCTNSCLNNKITSFCMLCGHQIVNTVFLIASHRVKCLKNIFCCYLTSQLFSRYSWPLFTVKGKKLRFLCASFKFPLILGKPHKD